MSQFQIQGPQAIVQPAKPIIYQESRTILPQQQITVTQGIDLGKIGQAAANLGIETVNVINEHKAQVTEAAIRKQTFATDAALKLAAERGDWATYDHERTKFGDLVKINLGYDPNTDEQPVGKIPSAMLANTRSSIAKWDNDKSVAQGEYANLVELDTFQRFNNLAEADMQKLPPEEVQDYIDNFYKPDLEALYRDKFKSDMFTEKTSRTKAEKAYARGLEAKWLDAQSLADRAMRGVKLPTMIESFDEKARVMLTSADAEFDGAAADLAAIATVLDKTPWDKLTPEEREKSVRISTLVSRGEQKLIDTMDTYLRIAYAIDEDRDKPTSFEKSKYNLKNKLSDEAYDIVTDLPGFSPEAANKLAQTRKSLGAFDNSQLVFIRKQSESILEAAVTARGLSISTAARAATTQIDYLTKLSKERPELSDILEEQQNKILAGVQQKIMETLTQAAPTSSRALFDTLIRSPVPSGDSFKSPIFYLSTALSAPSFELDVFGSHIDPILQTPRFKGEYDKYNEEYMKLASHVYGKNVGSEEYNNRRKKANDSFIRSQKIISASITGGVLVDNQVPPTLKEYLDAGLLALSSRMSSKDLFKEDGNMKTWEEVQLELNDGDKTALFNLELFQHTPYYDAFLQDVLNKRTTDTDSPRSVIEKTFASILSGPKGSPVSFDDIKNTQRHSVTKSSFTSERKNTFERGFQSEDPNTQTAFQSLALTLSPDDRDSLIVHLETSIKNVVDPIKKNQLTTELNKFKILNTRYDGTNPFAFVKKATLSSEQISKESSLKEANIAAEGSHVVPSSDKTPNAAELQKRAIVPYQKLMEEIYPSLTPGDQHDNLGSMESFRSALVLDLTKETEATRTITIRKQVDQIILEEALVLERNMSKDKEDFKPTLITMVNKRLSSFRLDYDTLRGYTRTSKGSKTDMPKNLTTSSGMNDLMPTDQIILNSKPLVGVTRNTTGVPMKPELAKTMLGQFMQVDDRAAYALSAYTDTLSPEIAAVVLPIGHKIPGNILDLAKGSGGKAGLIIALATGALGSNTDSAAILAAQYALQAIPDTINTEEQAVKWVTSEAAKIRQQLLEGSIFLTTENRQSYLDPDNVAPTYILYRGNKEYATLQPNSNTVSERLKDTEVGNKFIKSLDMKDAISKYNTFPESTEPEGYAPPEGRDFFVKDWLLSQPQPNLSFVPNPQKDKNLPIAGLLGATRFVYRKTTLDDGSVTVNRVLQQPSYNGNTTVWQDTEKLYPEKYDAVYNKGNFKTYYGLDPVTHTWLPNNTPVKVGDSSTGVPNKYEYSTSSPVRSIEKAPQYGAPVLLYNSGPTKKDRLDDALSNFDTRTQATISRAAEIAGVEGQQLITDVNRIEVAAEADTQKSIKNDTLRLLAKSINFTPYVEPTRETPGLWTTKVKTPLKSEDGTIKVDFEYLLDVFESPIPDQAGVPRRLIKPTVIYYNKKFILVPNPYNLEPEVLKDKYATENKSFAIFKNRDDATAYGESFTAYVDTVQQNFMNFYKQQQQQ
jgi:hypothetical protein